MADGQGAGSKGQYLREAMRLLGGRRLLAASVLTAATNVLALTGPAYTLLLFGHTLPKGEPFALLAATVIMLGLYALSAAIDIARQRLLTRCAHRIERRLTAMAGAQPGSIPPHELNAIRTFLGSQLPSALCDAPWIPLCLLALALLHPLLCALAMAGAASIAGCTLMIERRCQRDFAARRRLPERAAERLARGASITSDTWRRHAQDAAAHKAMLMAANLRALRPALQSTMLGLGGYLVMTGACHSASVVASAIILPRLLSPIETILAQRQILAAAHASAGRLAYRLASLPAGSGRIPPTGHQSAPGGVRIVLRRSGGYARKATRGGARSASSDLRPTAQ